MKISSNTIVSIHYQLKDAEGNEIDSSSDAEPLRYLHGAGNIIEGLEEALEGKAAGDEVTAVIPAEKAYGEPQEMLIQQVPKAAFGEEIKNVEIGMRFQAETERGPVPVVVTAIDGDIVTVDGNHPLAGKELYFEVRVSHVRPATTEEVDHGHPQAQNGLQH